MNFVEISTEEMDRPSWAESLAAFAVKVMDERGHKDWDLSLLLCNNELIRSLNARFREKDEATDILSFELGESFDDGDGKRYHPGDIVISLEMVEENARYFNVPLDEELRRLVIHGILHLEGRDHFTNDGLEPMLQLQETVLSNLSGERILP